MPLQVYGYKEYSVVDVVIIIMIQVKSNYTDPNEMKWVLYSYYIVVIAVVHINLSKVRYYILWYKTQLNYEVEPTEDDDVNIIIGR